jgi:hypothetical protein
MFTVSLPPTGPHGELTVVALVGQVLSPQGIDSNGFLGMVDNRFGSGLANGGNQFSFPIPTGQLDLPLTVAASFFNSARVSINSSTLTLTVPPGLTLEPVPLPAALPLFGTGLGALGLLG